MNYFDEDEIEEIAEGEVKVNPNGVTATVNLPDSTLESIAGHIANRLEQPISRRIEKAVMDKVDRLVDVDMTEAQIMAHVLWEMTFHGDEEQTKEFFDDLREQIDNLDLGDDEGGSHG